MTPDQRCRACGNVFKGEHEGPCPDCGYVRRRGRLFVDAADAAVFVVFAVLLYALWWWILGVPDGSGGAIVGHWVGAGVYILPVAYVCAVVSRGLRGQPR